mmetsp:Transcript_3478/g.10672  ORF Transcript_3478/g.10672 Transcript_3478/m.10672 type:complete len:491 (+) Transcript_3478:97-1569(+)
MLVRLVAALAARESASLALCPPPRRRLLRCVLCARRPETTSAEAATSTTTCPTTTSPPAPSGRLPKRKVALLLGYNGAKYWGFQIQSATPEFTTVESELQKALAASGVVSRQNAEKLSKCGWSRSARTDKGVSAARSLVTVKLEMAESESLDSAIARVNAELPPDIRVFDAVRVTKGFEAKRACDRRRYAYLLPECLLASPAQVEAIFGRHLSTDVETLREHIIASKSRGEKTTPSLWRVQDSAVREAVAKDLAAFRADPAVVQALQRFLRAYVGTRSFHNFTARMRAGDPKAKRFVLSFDVDNGVFVSFSSDDDDDQKSPRWLRLTVVGQSFILHQIRKMVAVAAEAARRGRVGDDDDAAKALLDGLCDTKHEIPLQLVPGEGLYLGEPIFQAYNQYKAPPDRQLHWDASHPKYAAIEAFRTDVVEGAILQDGSPAALLPFLDYLWQVAIYGFRLAPDDPLPSCNLGPAELAEALLRGDGDGDDDDDSR